MRVFSKVLLTATVALSLAACGGSNPPPEPPSATPEPPPADAPAAPPAEGGDGQHTMPDGTTMPGDQHGEGHAK